MGIPQEEQDLEMSESLPLYSEVSVKPTKIPEATATADEVREFFRSLLQGHASNEDAEAIAARWLRSTGNELKVYPPQMYLKIFGPEDGWFLYRETKLIMKREKDPTGKVHKKHGCKLLSPYCQPRH